jgi:hypothetical protein
MPAFMEREQDDYPTLVPHPTNPDSVIIIRTSTKHEGEVSYSMITGEVCYKLNPIPKVPIGITIGPTFDFILTKKIYQTYKIIGEPLNAQFVRDPDYEYTDNDRTIIINDGDIDGASSFRLGLKIGLQYEILTGTQMYIVPAIYYNLGITKVAKEDWRVNAIQIGVDVRWAL